MNEPAKIVALRSGELAYYPEADPEVVKCLEEWLEKARSGEIVGIGIAALYRDGSLGCSRQGIKSMGLAGEMFGMATRMVQE